MQLAHQFGHDGDTIAFVPEFGLVQCQSAFVAQPLTMTAAAQKQAQRLALVMVNAEYVGLEVIASGRFARLSKLLETRLAGLPKIYARLARYEQYSRLSRILLLPLNPRCGCNYEQ